MKLDFEKFLNENGLKVGDKIKFENDSNLIYEIVKKEKKMVYILEEKRYFVVL